MRIDTDKRYEHLEMPGVAWWIKGPELEDYYCEGHPCEDGGDPYAGIGDIFYCDGTCEGPRETGMVIAVMVGDDREHTVDPDDLREIGCSHG